MAQRYVIDANAALGLFLKLPYSEQVDRRMREWQATEVKLFVPTLWEYECVSGLHRAVVVKLITPDEADRIAEGLMGLQFQRIAPSLALHQSAIKWAGRIGQSKVYDAHYLALSESLSAEFYTADQRLFHAVQSLGINWIHSI